MSWHGKRAMVALCSVAVVALASCGSDAGEEPGKETSDEDAVLITQGTNPTVGGLSIGLSSVSGDEARMMIAQPEQQSEPVRATAGETIEVGDYTVEIFDVETNDEGGSVRLRVVEPEDG